MHEIIPKEQGGDLIRIHKVITRGIMVSSEMAGEFLQSGFPDDETCAGYVLYLSVLAATLEGHHDTEEEVLFPYLQAHKLDLPYSQLTVQHKQLMGLLEKLNTLCGKIAGSDDAKRELLQMQSLLGEIEAIWNPHIRWEEQPFLSGEAQQILSPAEFLESGALSAQHAREHGGPEHLTLPFMLFNLSTEERAEMSRDMPAVLTDELVPVVWKPHWAPMSPFLLD